MKGMSPFIALIRSVPRCSTLPGISLRPGAASAADTVGSVQTVGYARLVLTASRRKFQQHLFVVAQQMLPAMGEWVSLASMSSCQHY